MRCSVIFTLLAKYKYEKKKNVGTGSRYPASGKQPAFQLRDRDLWKGGV